VAGDGIPFDVTTHPPAVVAMGENGGESFKDQRVAVAEAHADYGTCTSGAGSGAE